jgi:hypothetical protein
MTVKVNTREKKVITVGAILAGAVLIFYAFTALLPDREGLSETVEVKKKMLLKQRETLGREETYKIRLEENGKHLAQDLTRLLSGENPNVAGAELQKILKDFADQSGVEITQKNILPEKKVQDRIVKVAVHIETNCGPEQLVQFLTAVENYEKFLTIDEFMVTSFKIQKKYEIRPGLTISGYISVPETKPGEKPEAKS